MIGRQWREYSGAIPPKGATRCRYYHESGRWRGRQCRESGTIPVGWESTPHGVRDVLYCYDHADDLRLAHDRSGWPFVVIKPDGESYNPFDRERRERVW